MILADMGRLECDWERVIKMSFGPQLVAMEAQKHCAYNYSRECFLGLDITTAALSSAALEEKLKGLLLRSGQGLWIAPFRGPLVSELSTALDLIFLDNDCRVVETVESFPAGSADLSDLVAASMLVLPVHSIYSSQTQVGDQLVVCEAEEMNRRLEDIGTGLGAVSIKSAALLREEPLWSHGSGVLRFETSVQVSDSTDEPRHEMDLAEPEAVRFRAPTSWLERWWSPDPRKAPRQPSHGLAAYYWSGSHPEPRGIRDISNTGIYVVTEERWYPGTLVVMTLQRTDVGEELKERSIAVQTRAVRWGHDGVGLQFVFSKRNEILMQTNDSWKSATPRELESFLRLLKKDK